MKEEEEEGQPRPRAQYMNYYGPAGRETESLQDDPIYKQYVGAQESLPIADPAAHQELQRAHRQMFHYFDRDGKTTQAEPVKEQPAQQKPTKAQLQQWKKRKEERKRIRHRWLFE